MKVSVALAYYHGGEYIKEQLESILCQIGGEDEVILSVDGALDEEMSYLLEVSARDRRVHLIEGPGQGVVKNFEYAILHCSGDLIFLSDQDDIWMEDKVETMIKYFEKNTSLKAILHNALLVDENGDPMGGDLFGLRHSNKGLLKNFIKNSYVGCCMAFRKELIPLICPIPRRMYMHDYWIGTIAELEGGVGLIKRPLIKYRRHSKNVTQMEHGTWREMIKKRCNILFCLPLILIRKNRLDEEI